MVTLIRFAPGVTVTSAARGFDYRQVGRICATAHTAVRQVRIEGEALAAMTGNATKCFDRMRGADLGQVGMAGEAVFGLACQGGNYFHWLRLA
jgi:hypothetical protein